MSSNADLNGMAARVRCYIAGASTWHGCDADAEAAFEEIARALFRLQFRHNQPYREFCAAHRTSPEALKSWKQIPPVPTVAFKELEMTCLPPDERTAVFHSSGTTGHQPSKHFHCGESLELYRASLLSWFKVHFFAAGARPSQETQLLGSRPFARQAAVPIGDLQIAILTPSPAEAPHSSLVHMFECVRGLASAAESAYFGKVAADGSWALDYEALFHFLESAKAAGRRLGLLGTAFSCVHLVDHLADQGLSVPLPPGSCLMETGGYKGRSRQLSKRQLHTLVREFLGIPPSHILCEYGMSELSSQAYALGNSRGRDDEFEPSFHFPPWARTQVVSPETGREVPEGETGLLRVFDLANVYSVLAVQTEDLAVRRADGFELRGRAALAEARGCSLMAAQA